MHLAFVIIKKYSNCFFFKVVISGDRMIRDSHRLSCTSVILLIFEWSGPEIVSSFFPRYLFRGSKRGGMLL